MRPLAPLLLLLCSPLLAAPPEQFRVWGSAGPAFPPVPEGWREEPASGATLTPWAPDEQERRQGFVLFARDPFAVVSPRAVPLAGETDPKLRAAAARGEYEPITFAIHALEPLEGVTVRLSTLKTKGGAAIPDDHVDVRIVRPIRVPANPGQKTYRLVPYLLERRPTFTVATGHTARVWITVKVPEGAAPGDYSGSIAVAARGREAARIPLAVRVLPFVLPPAPIETMLYFPRPPKDNARLIQQLIDQREHGCTAAGSSVHAEVKTRDRNFGEDDVAFVRAEALRMMGAAKQVFGTRDCPVTVGVGHQIAYYWDKQQNWFAFWPHSPKIESDLFKAIDLVTALAKAEGWPPLRIYALDEAGAHNLLDEATYYYGLIKKQRPQLTTWTTIGGGMAMGNDETGQLDGVIDFLATNRFTPSIARTLADRKKPYGIYNGAGHTPVGARFFFGFWGWKSGATQVSQWCYHFGNSVFEGQGFRRGDEGYAYLAPDGPLPSPTWEAVREGIDDYRYAALLWRLAAAAEASPDAAAKAAGKAARTELTQILATIGWGFQALRGADRTPPPHPATLRKWRARVARRIVDLGKALGDAAPKAGQAPAPTAFAFPWPKATAARLRTGSELLPPSGFEDEMAPWRVEAWKGKGKGTFDEAAAHDGKRSLRVDNATADGNQSVTVVVWPSWGKDKINLSLERDRIYEFSAWVRWSGRSTPPDIRIALPPGAATSTRSGRDAPAADGWHRIWTRAEMAFPATPKYLALWVQGPGTVWVDGLSLRQVIPQSVVLRLDQSAYDGLDRVGIATIEVAKTVAPAAVRFTLTSGDRTAARLEAPFDAHTRTRPSEGGLALVAPVSLRSCQFVFCPRELPAGRIVAKVELLDPRGTAFASHSALFERLAD